MFGPITESASEKYSRQHAGEIRRSGRQGDSRPEVPGPVPLPINPEAAHASTEPPDAEGDNPPSAKRKTKSVNPPPKLTQAYQPDR